MRQNEINEIAQELEDFCFDIITKAVRLLSKIIPDLSYLLSAMIDTGEKIQKKLNKIISKSFNVL